MNKKGITLIALVITIIVLMILASVTIASITSEDSLIFKTTESKEKNIKTAIQEYVLSNYTQIVTNPDIYTDTIDELEEKIAKDNLNKKPNEQYIIKSIDKENNKITVEHQGIVEEVDLNFKQDGKLNVYDENIGGSGGDQQNKFLVTFLYTDENNVSKSFNIYVEKNETIQEYLNATGSGLPKNTQWTPNLNLNESVLQNKIYKEQREAATLYDITYNLDGGNISGFTDEQIRKVKKNDLPPNLIPKRKGYTFLGWTPNIAIATNNKTYKAMWSRPMEIQMIKTEGVNEELLIPVTIPQDAFVLISENGNSYKKYTESYPTFTNNVPVNTPFTVKIAGRISEFSTYRKTPFIEKEDGTKDYLFNTQIQRLVSWGELGATSYYGAFFHSENLLGSIPSPYPNTFINNQFMTNLFRNCINLEGPIPEDLLLGCEKLTNMQSLFYRCSSLTGEIPDLLFKDCEKVTNMAAVFLVVKN